MDFSWYGYKDLVYLFSKPENDDKSVCACVTLAWPAIPLLQRGDPVRENFVDKMLLFAKYFQ